MDFSLNDNLSIYFAHQGYVASDKKTNSEDANITYYGFVNKAGNFYICEENITDGTWRFYFGESDYASAFAIRESLTYSLYSLA